MTKQRILILGAGFGGLELSTCLSEALGNSVDVTLVDKSDSFMFGFSKLDVLFGRQTAEAVRMPYADFAKPGVRLVRETVTAIDPASRRVTTNVGTHEADALVIALGADYDCSTTPGITLGENEFYSTAGATYLRDVLSAFTGGNVVIGVCGAPYKCPPAPSECALMLHDYLTARGIRASCNITIVNPLPSPVPPSPDTSKALLAEFAEHGITFIPNHRVTSVSKTSVTLEDGQEVPCDLFLGVPKNRAPDVVIEAGLTENGWVTIDNRTLETRFPNVYALGDLANTGAPKAGVFAEAAAKTVRIQVPAPATSNSARVGSPASMSTSFRGPSQPERSSRRQLICAPTRSSSGRPVEPVGSAADSP
jgi:sulfide:quinone oxidoreductase